MRKIIVIIFILLFLYTFKNDEYNITEDSIRFRVIANSNSPKDIEMKEKVVERLSKNIFIDGNKEQIEDNIYNNLKSIEDEIDLLFRKNNYKQVFNISYGLNEIPQKKYRGKVYKKGIYKSLIIEIGEGKGNNYFCILYPSLCLKDYEESKENKEVKFKIIEIIKKVF